MANYASVAVRIKMSNWDYAVRLYRILCESKAREIESTGDDYNRFHLKFLLDDYRVPEVEGLAVDGRSYFTYFDITDSRTVACDLEQPWSANLARFVKLIREIDPSPEVLFYAEEPMMGYRVSNDTEFLNRNRAFEYADIQE